MTTRITKKLSQLDGSPCNTCIVKITCTKSLIHKTACNEYITFLERILNQSRNEYHKQYRKCKSENKNKFYNK
jgi:hypothetical protein